MLLESFRASALVLVEFAHPGIGARFFGIGFLGYRTKVAVALAFAFLVGNTLTALLTLILGVLFGVMVGMEMRSAHRSSVQDWQPTPWQDPRWRALAGRYLGADAPEDTRLEPRPAFDMRRKFQEGLPPKISSVSVEDMDRERSRLEVNDAKWAACTNTSTRSFCGANSARSTRMSARGSHSTLRRQR